MTPEMLSSLRELDSRLNDGIHVTLLWSDRDGVWVSVVDTKTRDSFSLHVHHGERPLDVFLHPYAYAHHRGIATLPLPAAIEADEALAA